MKFSLVQAQLAIEAGPESRIGAKRVTLPEAVFDHGSISGVNAEIIWDLSGGKSLAGIGTRTSADALPLMVGDRACALIKSSHVILTVP